MIYSDRDVTKNYRNTFVSKPLRAKPYVDIYIAGNGRAVWSTRDIYNSLSSLRWPDKLFFVWNESSYRNGIVGHDGSKAASQNGVSTRVLL